MRIIGQGIARKGLLENGVENRLDCLHPRLRAVVLDYADNLRHKVVCYARCVVECHIIQNLSEVLQACLVALRGDVPVNGILQVGGRGVTLEVYGKTRVKVPV